MSEELNINKNLSREDIYIELYPQVEALIKGENDLIANMANMAAAIKEAFGFLWVGFYIVKAEELVLGPFQGPIACTRIKYGKGVCGTAWKEKQTVIVPDVSIFPGHIACSSKSQSEIVVPLLAEGGEVTAILDIDSEYLNHFSELDQQYLTQMLYLLY